ncbi:MAG: hypothetical protein Ct9H90mP15_03280 [Candidatus Neomarinimicrobiota bacterium]|nr:MAG: hypothetical protein Ct9H90mP15_03280 [Candidatus Neomarinimicrobiota bacterium]
MEAAFPSLNALIIVLEDPPAPKTRQRFEATSILLKKASSEIHKNLYYTP